MERPTGVTEKDVDRECVVLCLSGKEDEAKARAVSNANRRMAYALVGRVMRWASEWPRSEGWVEHPTLARLAGMIVEKGNDFTPKPLSGADEALLEAARISVPVKRPTVTQLECLRKLNLPECGTYDEAAAAITRYYEKKGTRY